jgi:type IX secretion system PorP/SprF family membrane protein
MLMGIALWLHTAKVSAQDPVFSQFNLSPLNLNPALTGNIDGKYRGTFIYRNQWRGAMAAPFKTASASFDVRLGNLKWSRNDKIGGGVVFTSDKGGLATLTNNTIMLSGAYHKALDMYARQYLTLGFQGGFGQRSINYEGITFNDQFNGVTGYTGGTLEELPSNNFSYNDLSAGVVWTVNLSQGYTSSNQVFAGAAFHHLTRPNMAFARGSGEPTMPLPMRISLQAGGQFRTGERSRTSLMPRMLVAVQGQHLQVNIANTFRIGVSDYSANALLIGLGVRPVRSFGINGTNVDVDALIVQAGVEFSGFRAGVAYDLNISSLSPATNTRGAFEISLIYVGDYDYQNVVCPTF